MAANRTIVAFELVDTALGLISRAKGHLYAVEHPNLQEFEARKSMDLAFTELSITRQVMWAAAYKQET